MLSKELPRAGEPQRKSKAQIIKESTHLEKKTKSHCFLRNTEKAGRLTKALSATVLENRNSGKELHVISLKC